MSNDDPVSRRVRDPCAEQRGGAIYVSALAACKLDQKWMRLCDNLE